MKCHNCGKSGIKLWRQYQTFHIELTCYKCSGDTREIDADGRVESKHFPGVRTDQLDGWLIPAVPIANQPGVYWGYTSVPEADAQKWAILPNE